jgi:hypothetical protein
MRRLTLFIGAFCLAASGVAGFKAKAVKPKKPEQFQVHATVSGITFAADLLLNGKDQRKFFYRELTPSNVVALRLAIYNDSPNEVAVPLSGIQLIGPDGKEVPSISPEMVAQAVLQGFLVSSEVNQPPVQVSSGANRRIDKSDPNYDPRLDPTDPSYDPQDPRNRGYNRDPYGIRRPGVGVILNPSGNMYNDISKSLIEKDFMDKAYAGDPIAASMKRDKFLYFLIANRPASTKGFELRLAEGKGVIQAVRLKF